MRLLLAERLAGPLRTKGGEQVKGVKIDGGPDFRGPVTSKTRATVDTLVTSIKHGGGALSIPCFAHYFRTGRVLSRPRDLTNRNLRRFSPLVPARHLSCATDQRKARKVTKASKTALCTQMLVTMLLLLSERLAGPLRTKGGERVL